jgi:hypothetical protein
VSLRMGGIANWGIAGGGAALLQVQLRGVWGDRTLASAPTGGLGVEDEQIGDWTHKEG